MISDHSEETSGYIAIFRLKILVIVCFSLSVSHCLLNYSLTNISLSVKAVDVFGQHIRLQEKPSFYYEIKYL